MKHYALFFTLLTGITAFGLTQQIQAMNEGQFPGYIPETNDVSSVTLFGNMREELSVAIQNYDYLQIVALTHNNGENALESFLFTHQDEALDFLRFAIDSLDTFTDMIETISAQEEENKEERTEEIGRWEKLRFSSLRIANLLIKNGAPEEQLSQKLKNTLSKFSAHYSQKKVRFS